MEHSSQQELQGSRVKDVLIAVVVYNEGLRVRKVVSGLRLLADTCDVVLVDDGSNDETRDCLSSSGFPVIRHDRNQGVGASIRDAIRYGLKRGSRFFVILAGNGKMDPIQIPRLLEPLLNGECDYVQGSRYLPGGGTTNLPLFRHVMIKIFTVIAWLLTGYKGTDVTCGFRAYSLSLFQHPAIDIGQDWLNRYELEFYIHYKAIRLGYRLREVPVSMDYPRDGRPYSKIKPFRGWWSMVKPWVLLSLNIRR